MLVLDMCRCPSVAFDADLGVTPDALLVKCTLKPGSDKNLNPFPIFNAFFNAATPVYFEKVEALAEVVTCRRSLMFSLSTSPPTAHWTPPTTMSSF